MIFTSEQKAKIQEYFTSGEYGIIARTAYNKDNVNPNADWKMVTHPEWRWDLYEYRAFAVTNFYPDLNDESLQLDPLFCFSYGYTIFYNEANNGVSVNLYSCEFNGTTVTNVFHSNVFIEGDFHACGGINTVGLPEHEDSTLTIIGETHDVSKKRGPKLRFANADSSNYVDLIYSDVGSNPTLTMSSSSDNEYLVVSREKVGNETVTSETVDTLKATNATINSATITSLNLTNAADVLYPVGSYYWTTKAVNPKDLFGGTWEQITNAFLYAAAYSDGNAITAKHGEAEVKLESEHIPTHNHTVVDPGHTHTVTDNGHGHIVYDPGHMHSIRTIGDDYNGSFCSNQRGTGNFVGDGHADMSSANWNRGIWANTSQTGISINAARSNVTIDSGVTNTYTANAGGGQPHNNMPPYIAAYCWHRIA